MRNIKLIVSYDGGAYKGWQTTRMGPSVESALQQTLERILQHAAPLQAASRTDAGVHAKGQVVNFFTAKQLALNKLQMSLNRLLPPDIAVLAVDQAPSTFHPTLDCRGKEYYYDLCYGTTQPPHDRFYAWHCPHPTLKLDEMREAARHFIGAHDFSAFCNARKQETYADKRREITTIDLMEMEDYRLRVRIKGNHFLYKMVRNLVGTLVDVGKGKIGKNSIPLIIQSEQRANAGVAAPAHGLFLDKINY